MAPLDQSDRRHSAPVQTPPQHDGRPRPGNATAETPARCAPASCPRLPVTRQGHDRPAASALQGRTAQIVFLLIDNFSHLAFSCAIEPLRIANRVSGRPLFRWSLASADGISAVCSNRAVTLVDRGLEPLRHVDRQLVISGDEVQSRATPEVLGYLRRERAAGTPIGAICSGAYLLASAGFLNDQTAAIHWEYHDLVTELFPEVRGVFVADQKFITAAGGTAAADMMLHLIATEHGADLATAVADQMVYNAVREATAEQRVSLQARHGTRNADLMRAVDLVQENLEDPLSPGQIACAIGISTRQIERLFQRHLGTSPKRFIMEARLTRARNLLVQTDLSITEVAIACGFRSLSNFSKVYRIHFMVSPAAQRTTLP